MSIEVQGPEGVERLPFDEFERRVRQGEIPAETLVRMEVLTGEDFRPVGSLELFQTLADPEHLAYARRVGAAAPLVTAALVGLQIRIYLSSKVLGVADWMVDTCTNWAPAVLEAGEVHRLLTYGVLHLSLTHLALNMLFLAYAGSSIERAMGRVNLVTIFIFSVFVGGLLSMWMSPGRPSLGASGGDFGLIAAAVVIGWKHEDQLPAFARKYFGWAILPYLVYPLCLGLLSTTVDNWGHLGGLIGGAAMATWLQPEGFERYRRGNRITRGVAVALGLLSLGAIAAWGPRLVQLDERTSATGLTVSVPTGWHAGWAFTEDRGWTSPLQDGTVVATTKVHRKPLSTEQAVEGLIAQVRAGGTEVDRTDDIELEVDGWPARRVQLRFEISGEPQVFDALVVVVGTAVHRVHVHGSADRTRRLHQIAERVFEGVQIGDPESLLAARHKLDRNPRSWKANLQVAEEEAKFGHPDAAWEGYRRALRDTTEDEAAIAAAILDLYADYGRGPDEARIDELIGAYPEDPRVVLAGHAARERLQAQREQTQ
ncbi:MAG: rhomboid family intramembrane serine protease [Proteobacteria bacterium]|nr:rhomboid family intramembrane serine protease [Pseudomonadota bacterium]MCP4917014.1 rhomboid family intramembrane serine protease [Pseudomonadota bacterium]